MANGTNGVKFDPLLRRIDFLIQRVSLLIGLVCFLAPFLAHIYLGSYSRMLADDYCSAALAQEKGILGSVVYNYQTWSGRYLAHLFDSVMGVLGPGYSGIPTPFILIAWFIVLVFTLSQFEWIYLHTSKRLSVFFLAALILYSSFEASPTITQSLYWGQGMRAVIPPLVLLTGYIGIVQFHLRTHVSKPMGVWGLFFLGCLTFIAGGFNETFALMQVVGLILVIGYRLISISKKFLKFLLPIFTAGLIGAILALIVIGLAPGNDYRQAFFPPPPGFFELIFLSSINTIKLVGRIALAPEDLLSILGAIYFSIMLGVFIGTEKHESQEKKDHNVRMALLGIPLFIVILLFVSSLPATYGMSRSLTGRMRLVPIYFLVSSMVAWGLIVGQYIESHRHIYKNLVRKRILQVLILSLAVIFLLNPVISGFKMIQSGEEYLEYSHYWQDTDQLIRQAKNQGLTKIFINVKPNWAKLFDLGNQEETTFVNDCMQDYYGIQIFASPSP